MYVYSVTFLSLQKAYENVCGDLHSLQQELSACTTDINQLRSELKQEQIQVCHPLHEPKYLFVFYC